MGGPCGQPVCSLCYLPGTGADPQGPDSPREGIHSDLAIGVARGDESGIAAHAWLEIDGTVIIGGEERDRYTRLKMQE